MFIQYLRWCAYLTLWLARDLADQTTNQKQISTFARTTSTVHHEDLKGTAWSKETIHSVVSNLNSRGFDCYWAGGNGTSLIVSRGVLGNPPVEETTTKTSAVGDAQTLKIHQNSKLLQGIFNQKMNSPTIFPIDSPTLFSDWPCLTGALLTAQKRQPRQHHLVLSHVLREGGLGEHRLCTSARFNGTNGWIKNYRLKNVKLFI